MNKSTQKISLTAIIPIGNVKGDLKVLKSWINESKKYPLKLVLVHDFYDVQTEIQVLKISKDFAKSKLKVITGKFGSPGLARNAGLKLVKSEWVAFWDCDDKPLLETIFNAISISSNTDEVIVGGFQVRNASNNLIDFKHSNKPTIRSISLNPGIWRMIFKYDLIRNVEFTNLKLAEDQLFIAELKLPLRKLNFISKSFYEYIYGGNNQLTSKRNNLTDLRLATYLLSLNTLYQQNHQVIFFNLTLILRQQFTVLKKGNFVLKFKAFYSLAHFALKTKPYMFWTGIKALMFVLANFKSSKL